MVWGICALLLFIILIISITLYILTLNKNETFLTLDETNLIIENNNTNNKPVEIQYQIPVTANQLSDDQLQSIDTDVLRNVRTLANFSMTDEFNFYQMYSLINKLKNDNYTFTYKLLPDDKKTKINDSEKLNVINSGAINTTDLELFSRLKLELISGLNSLLIKNNLTLAYHPFQFFKITNSNMISNNKIANTTNNYNYVFTITIAREYKYQQFVIYYDVDLISNGEGNSSSNGEGNGVSNTINYNIKLNKAELIGIPIPKSIEFHHNQKTDYMNKDSLNIDDSIDNIHSDKAEDDYYYKDQVSDKSLIDVMASSEKSSRFNSPHVKIIDITETNDLDNNMFNQNSASAKINERIMNVAKDQQFNNHRCYGLVNGDSKELPQYKNPIFCKSFHPEINQNGVWDAPCQVNSDCPFYKANKNYPNEFGKCDKITGQCEMPLGITPLGFTKYGKTESKCYNCGSQSMDSNCCETQLESIKMGLNNYKSPDFVFKDDESYRKQFESDLKSVGLLVNPSL